MILKMMLTVVGLCCAAAAGRAAAQTTQPSTTAPTTMPASPGANPAIAWLNPEITFYASFDSATLAADLAEGDAEPIGVQGKADFAAGKFGQALYVNPANSGARVAYHAMKNLSLLKPGAVSFWVEADHWIEPGSQKQRGIFEFFLVVGKRGGLMLVERMGFVELHIRDDLLTGGYFYFPGMNNASAIGGATLNWKKGEWHLIVMNWSRDDFELSTDGLRPQRVALSRPITKDDFAEDDATRHFSIGYSTSNEGSVIDELTVYRRSLTAEEIARIWRESK